LVVVIAVNLLPVYLITMLRGEVISASQPTSINSPASLYILIGGLASMLGFVICALLIIERLTIPPRLVLLPKDFDAQLKARGGTLLSTKFHFLTLGLIVIAISVIASIGYQQTTRALYTELNAVQIFKSLQTQYLILSGLILVLGIGFSYYATRSVSDPVKELIKTLQKIEQGDLSQRVPVTGTDELATVAAQFNHMVSRFDELQATLEKQVAERTRQLSATNEVGRVASSILDPDELLSKVINLLAEQFDYYFAAFYLLDPGGKWAELKEATGETGYVLKQNRHRLDITEKSMVATCIREKSPRILQNTGDEKQRMENPLLPYTRSEIALPLIVSDRVLGALNVQSTKASDFNLEVIETLQNMANHVAIALDNARLFQEAQQSIREMRAVQQQYLLQGWSGISVRNEDLEYGIGEAGDTASQIIQTHISLRDQILGQITLEGNEEWTPEQQNLVDAIANQAAVALENARLVLESRQIATRERTLAEINSKVWSSTTIDGVLQTVIKELGRRLDASSATIELNLDEEA
jgi:GAF domain-containing protein